MVVRACALAGGGSSNSAGPIAAGVICSVVGVAAIVAVAVVIRRRRQRGATVAKSASEAWNQDRGISNGNKVILSSLPVAASHHRQAAQTAGLASSVPIVGV